MSEPPDSELIKLFAAVHDQNASAEEVAALDQWLRNNPDGQRKYVEFIDTMHEVEHQIGDKARLTRGNADQDERDTRLGAERSGRMALPTPKPWRHVMLAVAASLLTAVGVYLWSATSIRNEMRASAESDSEVVGIVTAAQNSKGYYRGKTLQPGSAFKSGLLRLDQGTMKLRLESGVEISLAAPAEIDVRDSQQIAVRSGALTADVPESVIGFTVEMPGLNVVDLGTTFGVNVPRDGQPQVHVFDGVVDAEVQGNDTRLRLTDDQTVRFDGKSLSETKFQEEFFVRPRGSGHRFPVASGDVRFLETPPHSVALGQFEHEFILCFRERDESITVTRDVPVSLDTPGRYHVYPRWQNTGVIPAGTKLDSYFVHLDAVGFAKTPRQGSITFDRPILGIVFSRRLMLEQNEIFGDFRTDYEPAKPNARYDPTLENESVTLSADRRTIQFRWFIRNLSDQVRVLVDAGDRAAK